MIDERPLGIVIALLGAVGTAVAAFADPLGIGEGHVFGWLQITGVVIGGVVTLLGIVMAMEWMPYPERSTTTAAGSAPQTNIVTDSSTRQGATD